MSKRHSDASAKRKEITNIKEEITCKVTSWTTGVINRVSSVKTHAAACRDVLQRQHQISVFKHVRHVFPLKAMNIKHKTLIQNAVFFCRRKRRKYKIYTSIKKKAK